MLVPAKIGPPGEKELLIQWKDGKLTVADARKLRLSCPCAACVNEITGERTLRPESVPQEMRVSSVSPVGRYALHLAFSDGHDTGLFSYERLHAL